MVMSFVVAQPCMGVDKYPVSSAMNYIDFTIQYFRVAVN